MVTRNLVNKDANFNIETNTVDAKYALGTYFFNDGPCETFSTLFNHDEQLNWKICGHSLEKIRYYDQTRKTNDEKMKKKKARKQEKIAAQKKHQCNPKYLNEPGIYVTARQKRKNPPLSLQSSHQVKKKK